MRAVWLFAAVALLALPELAEACSVCAATLGAFRLSTAFLTVLPLALFGGVGWWLARRIRAHDARNLPEPARTSSSL